MRKEKENFVFFAFVLRLRLRFVASHLKISGTTAIASARHAQEKQTSFFLRLRLRLRRR